jgi:hypothetical protein
MKAPSVTGPVMKPKAQPKREQSIGTASRYKAPKALNARSIGAYSDNGNGARQALAMSKSGRSRPQAARLLGRENAITRGQGKKIGLTKKVGAPLRKGPPVRITGGPSYRGSASLSDGSRNVSPQNLVSNAYKSYASSMNRLAGSGAPSGGGLKMPSFEAHFDMPDFGGMVGGLGDTIRRSNPVSGLFDAIGNRIKDVTGQR